ncbi:MAG: Crp/Fnr family transcriptional regulator [bacterium]|nr:Crp/Fnr family transcriptional regulator [bacterium]
MHEFLIKNFNISSAEADLFSSSFDRISIKKGEKFIDYGQVCNKVGFIEKGLLKCTLMGNGKSIVDDFAFENQFVANYYSFLNREKSNKELVCLKDSVLRVITRKKLEELAIDHAFIESIARQISERLFLSTAKKLEDLKLLSAEERYLKLVKLNKRVINEIPQYEIASYLNVSPETVSRIRNVIASRS